MNALPLDAGTVCMALELDAAYIADVFRREAALALHDLAVEVEGDGLIERGSSLEPQMEHVTRLLLIVSAFEDEWERQEGESDEAVGRNGGDSLTPAPPTSPDEIVPESRRVEA